MAQLDNLETKLDDVLRKKAPFQLPPDVRSWIARNLWWLSLLAGLSALWSAIMLWQAGHAIDRYLDIYGAYVGQTYVHHLGLFYYLSLMAIAGGAILTLVAAANLKDLRRSGWRYMFYAAFLQVLASACLLFSDYGGGFGRFLSSLIGSVVGLYFLFQVRDFFTKADVPATTDVPPIHTHHDAPAAHKASHAGAGKTKDHAEKPATANDRTAAKEAKHPKKETNTDDDQSADAA